MTQVLLSSCVLLLSLTCIRSWIVTDLIVQSPKAVIDAGLNTVKDSISKGTKVLQCGVSQITSIWHSTVDVLLQMSLLSRSSFKELFQHVCPAQDLPTVLKKTFQYLIKRPVKKLESGLEKIRQNFPLKKYQDCMAGENSDNESKPKYEHPIDCAQVMANGQRESGVYTIWPKPDKSSSNQPLEVFCDMDTEGGGWTVIQRRGKFCKQEDFNRKWDEYKKGFGELTKEFWIGNENIFTLTNQASYSIRFDLERVNGSKAYGVYESFWIDDEVSNYTLHIANFSSAEGLGDSMSASDGAGFSTKDRGHDTIHDWVDEFTSFPEGNFCSVLQRSGWWYHSCSDADLNTLYRPGSENETSSVRWKTFNKGEGLAASEMKVKLA